MAQGQHEISFGCECGVTLLWSGLANDHESRRAIKDEIERHGRAGHEQIEPHLARRIRTVEKNRQRRQRGRRIRNPQRRPIRTVVVRKNIQSKATWRDVRVGVWHAVAQPDARRPEEGPKTACGRSIPTGIPEAQEKPQKGWERQAVRDSAEATTCQICLKRGSWPTEY